MADHDRPITRRTVLQSTAALPLAQVADAFADATQWTHWGLTLYRQYTRDSFRQAKACLTEALRLAPDAPRTMALLATVLRQEANHAWAVDRLAQEAEALTLSRQAVEHARGVPEHLPWCLVQAGWSQLYIAHDHAAALAYALEAQERAPADPDGYGLGVLIYSYLGQPELAFRSLEHARHLEGRPTLHDAYHRGHVFYTWSCLTGNPTYRTQAVSWCTEALARNPQYRPARSFRCAAFWDLGLRQEAQADMGILAAVGRPQASQDYGRFADYVRRGNPYANPAITDYLLTVWQAAETGNETGERHARPV
jgi:tetratricopeptide (TPR) repeat protein